jgi:hypothetical protein
LTGLLFFTLLTALPAFGAGNKSCPLPLTSAPALHYDRIEIPSLHGADGTVEGPDTRLFSDLRDPDAPAATSSAGSAETSRGAAVRFETASPFTPYLGAAIGPVEPEALPVGKPDSAPPENLPPTAADRHSAGVAGSLPELANPLGLASDPADDDHHISVGLKLAF